jgi:transcriptional regulator with XRE-family HTH domain/DNA-binding NarL/FixJ family response regulator
VKAPQRTPAAGCRQLPGVKSPPRQDEFVLPPAAAPMRGQWSIDAAVADREERLAARRVFGAKLRLARERAGISQGELAARGFFRSEEISEFERGIRSPRLETVPLIAAEIETPVSELMDGLPQVTRRASTEAALTLIATRPEISAQDVANTLGLPHPYTQHMLRRLERRRMISRVTAGFVMTAPPGHVSSQNGESRQPPDAVAQTMVLLDCFSPVYDLGLRRALGADGTLQVLGSKMAIGRSIASPPPADVFLLNAHAASPQDLEHATGALPPDVRIVAMADHPDHRCVSQLMTLGIRDYVPMDASPADLCGAIHAAGADTRPVSEVSLSEIESLWRKRYALPRRLQGDQQDSGDRFPCKRGSQQKRHRA